MSDKPLKTREEHYQAAIQEDAQRLEDSEPQIQDFDVSEETYQKWDKLESRTQTLPAYVIVPVGFIAGIIGALQYGVFGFFVGLILGFMIGLFLMGFVVTPFLMLVEWLFKQSSHPYGRYLRYKQALKDFNEQQLPPLSLDEATKIVSDFDGYIEFVSPILHRIFCTTRHAISLLPYPAKRIAQALDVALEDAHARKDEQRINTLEVGWAMLANNLRDDEEAILKMADNFKHEKVRGHHRRKILDYLIENSCTEEQGSSPPRLTDALTVFEAYSNHLMYVDRPISAIFMTKPKGVLPFPKEHIVNALNVCATNDMEHAELYTSLKAILEESRYVENEEALYNFIEELLDESKRHSMISRMRRANEIISG